jgi:hypothetical protein
VPSGDGDPELPIWLHEDRVVITPLDGSVRFAGTMELSGVNHDGLPASRCSSSELRWSARV